MSLAIFSFIFVMWILIIIGGGLMVLFVGPLSFSGDGDLDPSHKFWSQSVNCNDSDFYLGVCLAENQKIGYLEKS